LIMRYQKLGDCFEASRLTLGGGGIGQVWGATDRSEALATVRLAADSGINFFDMAPMYGSGEAESVMGQAFAEGLSKDVHLTTKYLLGDCPEDKIFATLSTSLEESFARMGREYVDLFILHGFVIADGWSEGRQAKLLPRIAVPMSKYQNAVIPAFERLKASGRIGAWGVTTASTQRENIAVVGAAQRPDVVQCITNVLDSSGSMSLMDEVPGPRQVITNAQEAGIGVMGIRAVAAGSLTDALDRDVHPKSAELKDFQRCAGFRELAKSNGVSAAYLAHLYALSMPGVDTLVLGVKNRNELIECLAAEAAEPMSTKLIAAIDTSVAR
jgi:aryl-alcohol dehydrogenase-like predicted oxidoreductase